MSGAELGLAIVGTVDLCLRYGRELVATCKAFREADARLAEGVLRVEACWVRFATQLEMVKDLAPHMEDRHREVQYKLVETMLLKLRAADERLVDLTESGRSRRLLPAFFSSFSFPLSFSPPSSASTDLAIASTAGPSTLISASSTTAEPMTIPTPGSPARQTRLGSRSLNQISARRFKFALARTELADTVADLEAWHAAFDPSWFMLMGMTGGEVDRYLSATRRNQRQRQSEQEDATMQGLESPEQFQAIMAGTMSAARHLRRAITAPSSDGTASLVLVPSPTPSPGPSSPPPASANRPGLVMAQSASSTMTVTSGDVPLSWPSAGTSSKVTLPPGGLVPGSVRRLPFSPCSIGQRVQDGDGGESRVVLLDPVTCTTSFQFVMAGSAAVLRDVRDFAQKLVKADPSEFGMLRCKGIMRAEGAESVASSSVAATRGATNKSAMATTTGLAFVFHLPVGYCGPGPWQTDASPTLTTTTTAAATASAGVRSLRAELLSGRPHDSLTDRFALARRVVRAVCNVHTFGFVHKNIRPETILALGSNSNAYDATLTETAWTPPPPPPPLTVLVGFDVLRRAEGRTGRVGDDDWEKNLYRHPRRQGREPQDDFEMRHDIYSAGVVLLELGLWESFVRYEQSLDGAKGEKDDAVAGNTTPDFDGWPVPGRILAPTGLIQSGDPGNPGPVHAQLRDGAELMRDPDRVKAHLLRLARTELRRRMGSRYAAVVETCLTCLDEGNEDFGDDEEFRDEDGVAVGVRYVMKVVARLADINV